jgi:hypothetical protein
VPLGVGARGGVNARRRFCRRRSGDPASSTTVGLRSGSRSYSRGREDDATLVRTYVQTTSMSSSRQHVGLAARITKSAHFLW